MWTGENDTKTLVWMKIFCCIFAAMKTDTFENALCSKSHLQCILVIQLTDVNKLIRLGRSIKTVRPLISHAADLY